MPAIKTSFITEHRLPIVYEPSNEEAYRRDFLLTWIPDQIDQINEHLRLHGAVLFRGFAVPNGLAFEQVALALEPQLSSEYPGVATRSHVTKFVHTSTELPPHYPVPQHAEMAYTPSPPRKIFFFCEVAPKSGGETPLCDLRKVWQDLPEALRERFENGLVRYARVHGGPSEGLFRLWGGRRWSDVFQTQDRAKVEQVARVQELTPVWLADGALRLQNTLPAVRVHPLHGTRAWHNHANVFHPDGPLLECERILQRQRTVRSFAVNCAMKCLTLFRRWFVPAEQYDWNVTFGDGSEISRADLAQIYGTIWKHLSCFTWQPGDLVMVDNYSVSHGRMPFHGKRKILVAMTDSYPAA